MSLRHAALAARLVPELSVLLTRWLPADAPALLLELGSGTGEQAVYLAARLPWITWQPSDPDPESRASIAAWTARTGVQNVLAPLSLDLLAPTWRLRTCDALLLVNVLHAAPAGATEALLAGAAGVLSRRGPLVVVGPAAGAAGAPMAALEMQAPPHGLAVVERRALTEGCAGLVLRSR
jgi:Protein of unknown function (DUF938)